jgi:hypothetical protein
MSQPVGNQLALPPRRNPAQRGRRSWGVMLRYLVRYVPEGNKTCVPSNAVTLGR